METVRVNTSQHVDIDYPVAGLGERIGARLIDGVLFGAVFVIFLLFVGFSGLRQMGEIAIVTLVCVYFGGYVFYDLACEIFWNGQSVGKRLLKIKVISLDGAQPSVGQYFIRWVFRLVDFTLTGSLCALICVAVSEKKQRVGDIVAGTTLIKTKPRTQFGHIAFHQEEEAYQPVFEHVHLLSDRDIELIHEVLQTYYKTYNEALIYEMAAKVTQILGIGIPAGMNELDFLRTIVRDYSHITARA
ncbi:MAG: RDD family protein [Pedobacter sp.]|nr:RDD family protein [Pedobacter sp.]MDQ8053102.1 RDD family protein [Pedobacter sp.]